MEWIKDYLPSYKKNQGGKAQKWLMMLLCKSVLALQCGEWLLLLPLLWDAGFIRALGRPFTDLRGRIFTFVVPASVPKSTEPRGHEMSLCSLSSWMSSFQTVISLWEATAGSLHPGSLPLIQLESSKSLQVPSWPYSIRRKYHRGDGSIGNAFALQMEGPEFRSPEPVQSQVW